MEWFSRFRWQAQWANYWMRWLGYCLAAAVLTLVSGVFWLAPLPWNGKWYVLAAAAVVIALVTAWTGWRSAPDELLRSVDREFAGELGSRRTSVHGSVEDPFWNDAFVGMFCGPVLTVLLSAVVYTVAGRLGYHAPSDRAFAFNLLLGCWLGLFTWTHLGTRFAARETGRWLLGSGAVALAVIMWVAVMHSRLEDGSWSRAHFWGTLFILIVPFVWSVLHLIQGSLAHLGGPFHGRRPWDDQGPGSDDRDGGAGRPVPTLPVIPRRSSGYAEPRPEPLTSR